MSTPADVYTFGDNPAAARRLALLADVYEPVSRDLLARWSPPTPGHALDLGCGPGHSTRLLHVVSGAVRSTGVDRSADYLRLAGQDPAPGISFVCADVLAEPLPVDPADLVYARFLLAHLADPGAAVRRWARLVRPGGRLLLQESARLVSRDPALARYYELVAQLQARYGQALDVGARMADLAAGSGLAVRHLHARPLRPSVPAMAALHVLNLRTWREDRYARAAFDEAELDALDGALAAIAHGAPAEPIEQELAELVLAAE